MAFDYKKEYKDFYLPKGFPQIVEIPRMNYIAVRGKDWYRVSIDGQTGWLSFSYAQIEPIDD